LGELKELKKLFLGELKELKKLKELRRMFQEEFLNFFNSFLMLQR